MKITKKTIIPSPFFFLEKKNMLFILCAISSWVWIVQNWTATGITACDFRSIFFHSYVYGMLIDTCSHFTDRRTCPWIWWYTFWCYAWNHKWVYFQRLSKRKYSGYVAESFSLFKSMICVLYAFFFSFFHFNRKLNQTKMFFFANFTSLAIWPKCW